MRPVVRLARRRAALALLLTTAVAPAWAGQLNPVARSSVQPAPLYDLERDERLGGHTIERHVGRSDRELADRLRREPQIGAASSFADLETAQRVVGDAVTRSRTRIDSWVRRTGSRPNLVLEYEEPADRPIGRSLARGTRVAVVCTRALIVLRWNDRQQRWYVLTSYPEPPR